MITVKLLGGLGNQMFQAAYGAGLVREGYEVQFDTSSLIERTHREYSLDYFRPFPLGRGAEPVMFEKGLVYNSDYLSPEDPCTMVGYWQNERYFEKAVQQVSKLFTFERIMSPVVAALWDRMHASDSIALHIRRQDYVHLQHVHGMPSIDYYREGVAFIRRLHFDAKVFVFSDDVPWCRENFPQDFTFVQGTDKYEDLRLMSLCKHAVIANSSFSWWGAWLQQKPDGIIVAPKRWFTTPDLDDTDIVPQRWVRI